MNFQMFKLLLEKAEEPEIILPTSLGSQKSKRVPEKHLFLYIDYTKAFDCMDKQTVDNSSRDGNIRPPFLPPDKSVGQERSNS